MNPTFLQWAWKIISNIPAIVSLVTQLIKMIKGNPETKYVKASAVAFKKMNKAKTPKERYNAIRSVKSLHRHIGK